MLGRHWHAFASCGSVTVVDGPLAFGMRRFQATRANDVGLEILTLPLLATRLAGGFRRLADRETLSTAVAQALREGGFTQLDDVRNLPGMVRAALSSTCWCQGAREVSAPLLVADVRSLS